MELRHLRYFVAVAETLSFTRGARELHLSQPSLTRQIRDLEEELGVRLLDRNKRHVNLTEEGTFFLADAKRLLAHGAQMVESVRSLSRHEAAVLNIGYAANLFYTLLPVTLASFQQLHPTVSINLFDMTCGDQFLALEEGNLDLGFVGMREPIEQRGLDFRRVGTSKTVVALPKNHRLVKKSIVRLRDLESMFFIGISETSYPGYRQWLIATCQRIGFTPKILQDTDIERTLIHAVAAGLGVALLPSEVRKFPHQDVLFRPLNPAVETESCIAWKKGNASAALEAYIQIVADAGASMR